MPNDHAIRMYPSTCFFEGTVISEGRGTPHPFEVYGHPSLTGDYSFVPVTIPGVSENPKFRGERCFGEDLTGFFPAQGWSVLQLQWLMSAYKAFPQKEKFFTSYFEKLAGTASLRRQIEEGWDEDQIRKSWEEKLKLYLNIREKYLIYD